MCFYDTANVLPLLHHELFMTVFVATNEEKVKEIKEELEKKENELAMVKKMSKVKDARNRELEERAKKATGNNCIHFLSLEWNPTDHIT